MFLFKLGERISYYSLESRKNNQINLYNLVIVYFFLSHSSNLSIYFQYFSFILHTFLPLNLHFKKLFSICVPNILCYIWQIVLTLSNGTLFSRYFGAQYCFLFNFVSSIFIIWISIVSQIVQLNRWFSFTKILLNLN